MRATTTRWRSMRRTYLEPKIQPDLGQGIGHGSFFRPRCGEKSSPITIRTRMSKYGLPLDNRSKYTKLDWIYWTASLGDSREDFDALIAPTWKFANESPSRVPLTDWYWTQDAKQRGFQARSVVGGVFMKMLTDPAEWKKWVAARY